MGDGLPHRQADQFGAGVAGIGRVGSAVGVAGWFGGVGKVVATDGGGVSVAFPFFVLKRRVRMCLS